MINFLGNLACLVAFSMKVQANNQWTTSTSLVFSVFVNYLSMFVCSFIYFFYYRAHLWGVVLLHTNMVTDYRFVTIQHQRVDHYMSAFGYKP